MLNPELSLFEALRIGGFDYPTNDEATIVDTEKVTLGQRKNQLSRRLRLARKQNSEKNDGDVHSISPSDSASRTNNFGALALQMKNQGPFLAGLLDDDYINVQNPPKRHRIAKFHPDYAPLFVPHNSSAPSTTSNHSAQPSMFSTDNSSTFMNHPYSLPPTCLYNQAAQTQQIQQPRASAVAISSLTGSAQSLGMTLEQLAMNLSSNPSKLSKIVLGSKDDGAPPKLEELALHLYSTECRALYSKCMLMAGVDPKLCNEKSYPHLEFAMKAWQAEGRRLQEVVRNTQASFREAPLESTLNPAAGSRNATSDRDDASAHSSAQSPHQHSSRNHNHSGHSHSHGKTEDGEESRHIHRLDGQCGHKAIIHHPKDGVAHIDFVIGQVVECYHGIEPSGNKTIWPSKYKCKDIEDCSNKGNKDVDITTSLMDFDSEKQEPKIIPLSDINLQDPEWNFDVGGSIDGGVSGLFKLGEMTDDMSNGGALEKLI
jgi:hypothetical protein